MSRQITAQFLFGLIVLPLCILFGLMESLLFRASITFSTVVVLIISSVPVIGAVRSRQWVLLAGLISGAAGSLFAYLRIHNG